MWCPHRWAHRGPFNDSSLTPTLHQGGGSDTPSHLSQVPEAQPGTHSPTASLLILPWGQKGDSHLLFAAGPPAWPSGTSMGLPGCSAGGGETKSLPPSLGGADKGSKALRAPGRTNGHSLLRPDTPPHLCPRPLWVLRTCLPTPASTRAAPAQTCFMDWRCGLGKGAGARSGQQRSKSGWGWGSLPPCFPSTRPVKSLTWFLLALRLYPVHSSPSLHLWARPHPFLLDPHPILPSLPVSRLSPPMHPHRAPELTCPSPAQCSPMAPQYPRDRT